MLALLGCGGSTRQGAPRVTRIVLPVVSPTPTPTPSPSPSPSPTPSPSPSPSPNPAPAPPPPPPPFTSDILSVQFKTNTIVLVTPSKTADRAGIVSGGTRSLALHEQPAGDGCARRWIEIAPRGWVCETSIEPSHEPPTIAPPSAAALDDDSDVQLGTYGVVVGANPVAYDTRDDAANDENARPLGRASSVRAAGTMAIDGKTYWITTDGSLIDAASIVGISPSEFRGVALPDHALAIAWVHRHDKPREPAELHDAAGALTGEPGRAHASPSARSPPTARASASPTTTGSPASTCGCRRCRRRPTAPPPTRAGSTSTSTTRCWSPTRAAGRSTRRWCRRGAPTTRRPRRSRTSRSSTAPPT